MYALFLSTLSLRRATKNALSNVINRCISIHALLAESDTIMDNVIFVPRKFLSTLSLRRATPAINRYHHTLRISIHALLAESDRSAPDRIPADIHFYPRSPCGERLMITGTKLHKPKFLSTLSLRRATSHSITTGSQHPKFLSTLSLRRATGLFFYVAKANNFYPRSPCGERRRPIFFTRNSE